MSWKIVVVLLVACSANVVLADPALTLPVVSADRVIRETDGFVEAEAENFVRQEKAEVRAWYRTSGEKVPVLKPDADPPHLEGAQGGAYLEILPDTRKNHGEKLIVGENFSNEPGKLAILSYRVHFENPGRYYVWARTHSTGTEDNGLHVGIDGEWPESGQRMQWTKKKQWAWGSKQRTEKKHSGVPGILYLDVKEAGEHTIQFSMREDGFEFDAWIMTTDKNFVPGRGPTGNGKVTISGEQKMWHKVTLDLEGPFATEGDVSPNPFTDYRYEVIFENAAANKTRPIPGYFAADGRAAESSVDRGNCWRVNFVPDALGEWTYTVRFFRGTDAALDSSKGEALAPYDGIKGTFRIGETDKTERDFRALGFLTQAKGSHYLQFQGSGEYFLKAGADAPETFLGYADFDGTIANNPKKCPLKTWQPHVQDWRKGDPTWKGGKGKGMIGAINYLSSTGCNAFSFLTYNAGGDGDNVWPFVERDDPLHYDCSKLDQWGVVFDHAVARGMFLHFKLQETENDDQRGKVKNVPTALDGGTLGRERKLYLREIVARFGHCLALNWNLGEENTQSTEEQIAMANYLKELGTTHPIVIHTYPGQQEKVYGALIDKADEHPVRGASLQNSNVSHCHRQTVYWRKKSADAGVPWLIAFDEPGTAGEGTPADPGYPGMPDDFDNPSIHTVRKHALWGTLMGGGWGIEYYFGYKLPQNDLICEDWRSRAKIWEYSAIALDFFREQDIPFWEMTPMDKLVGNEKGDNSCYGFGKTAEIYLVYIPERDHFSIDLSDAPGEYRLDWLNPRTGEVEASDETLKLEAEVHRIETPTPKASDDWLAVLRFLKPIKP